MNSICKYLFALIFLCVCGSSQAGPEEDKTAFQNYFKHRFPSIHFDEFINGIYAIDQNLREQWEAIEELPPYEIAISDGETLAKKPLSSGRNLISCFKNDGVGAAANYPYFDLNKGKVITLPLDVNECLIKNGEKPLGYEDGPMLSILSYLASLSRGFPIHVENPAKHPAALKAYEKGKHFYYARRGQMNLSCAHCHVDYAGKTLRGNLLGPALGQISHFPVYRSKWGTVGTLHRRFSGCLKQMAVKPFKPQSEQYRDLEYFLTYMSNGLTWNGPGTRF